MTVSRSVATRLLHLLLLLAVVHQLVNSQFIRRPHPGDPPSLLWALHQYVGVTALLAVSAFWVAADVAKYARSIVAGKLVDDRDSAFAEAVHGLGLLVVSMMAVTGTIWLLTATGTAFGRTALNVHKLFANLMWAYLVAHAGLAVLHHLLGSDIFSRMFLSRRIAAR